MHEGAHGGMNTALLVHDQIPSSTAQEEQTQLPLEARESPRMLRPSDPPMNTALLGHAQIPSSTAVEERAQLSRHEQAVRSLYDLCRLVQHSRSRIGNGLHWLFRAMPPS